MMLWFHSSLLRQLLGIALFSLLATALDYWWAPTPPVRLQIALILRGAAAGCFISFVTAVLSILGRRQPDGRPREDPDGIRSLDLLDFLGFLCLGAIGEEVLFRGYIFNGFLRFDPWLAFIVHGAIVFAAYYAGRKRLRWLLIRCIEASLLAFAFFRTKSLALSITAHLVLLLFRRFLLPELFRHFNGLFPLNRRRPGPRQPFSALSQ